jgi:hypothetical protein
MTRISQDQSILEIRNSAMRLKIQVLPSRRVLTILLLTKCPRVLTLSSMHLRSPKLFENAALYGDDATTRSDEYRAADDQAAGIGSW